MNEIVTKFLLAGEKFMSKMHLNQSEFKEKFKETGDSRYIFQNGLYKVCFQHDMAYADFKDLTRRTASDKIFQDKAFNIAKSPKYDGYQKGSCFSGL